MSNDLIQYESDDGFEYDDTIIIHDDYIPSGRKREGMLRKTKRTLKDYFRRLYYCRQMDFEYALSLMIYLWKDPFKVHNTFTKFHKQTKNQWARDDPAFVVIFLFFLVMSSISWTITFKLRFEKIILNILYIIFVDFFIVSIIISTITWAYTNKFLVIKSNDSLNADEDRRVEWFYAFDVHCNSYFSLFLYLHVVQFLFLPIYFKIRSSFIATIISNSLHFFAYVVYLYITSYGFTALPFLRKTQSLLYPSAALLILFILSLLFNFNLTTFMINYYYS